MVASCFKIPSQQLPNGIGVGTPASSTGHRAFAELCVYILAFTFLCPRIHRVLHRPQHRAGHLRVTSCTCSVRFRAAFLFSIKCAKITGITSAFCLTFIFRNCRDREMQSVCTSIMKSSCRLTCHVVLLVYIIIQTLKTKSS